MSSVLKVDQIQSDTGTVNVASKIEFPVGSAAAPSIFPTGDTNTGIFFPAADTIAFAEGGAEVMRIDSNGNVGIGTNSPGSRRLLVSGSDGAAIGLVRGDSFGVRFGSTTVGAFVEGVDNTGVSSFQPLIVGGSDVRFATGGTERARITSGGALLIGTTSGVAGKLAAVEGSNSLEQVAYFENTNASFNQRVLALNAARNTTNGSYTFLTCSRSAVAEVLKIFDSGNVQNTNNSYGSLSDAKLKENIVDASPKLEKLNQVRVVNYNLKDTPDQKLLGVVAQELEQIFPGLVEETPDKDAEGNELGTVTKGVKYSVFVPMLIKAMQEQQAIINELKAINDAQASRIETLEAKVSALESQ